jgi:hypothetical protein
VVIEAAVRANQDQHRDRRQQYDELAPPAGKGSTLHQHRHDSQRK